MNRFCEKHAHYDGQAAQRTFYFADILQAAREIAEYTALDQAEFLGDKMRQRAVTQCFEIIGEASKKLPAELRDANTAIPWRYMAAFRDKLIHDYFEIDLKLVWATSQTGNSGPDFAT